MTRFPLFAAALAVLPFSAVAQSIDFANPLQRSAPESDITALIKRPNADLEGALSVLKSRIDSTAMIGAATGAGRVGTQQSPGVAKAAAWSERNNGVSAAIQDQILIRFDPDASEEDIADVIEAYNLEVTDVYVGLGAINARTDLSGFYHSTDTPDQQLQATVDVANAFTIDPRILAATPNIAIGANSTPDVSSNLTLVPRIATDIDFEQQEYIDWGMENIGVTGRWDDPRLFGPRVGVIDVGFAAHEDLTFDRAMTGPADDHGNHVAGILCAKHDNRGVAGVVPNCQIVAKTGNFLPLTPEGDNVNSFLLLFSQILLSMNEFVTDRDDVVAFNASLGYNWKQNFGIDPSDPESETIRATIQSQALFLLPVLEAAAERDILIFSAAGNDSSADDPRDAVYASPFNWAARTACAELGVCSGVIVEAHDEAEARAPFSNVNGDISCPGVDILSAVSAGPFAFAHMSGTSMAAPYCTGGFVVFSMLRPGYSSSEALACLVQSGSRHLHGTPRMDVEAALDACPRRI